MSFGRKGLATGAAAQAAPGGFGRAPVAATPSVEDIDDIAAKREAFIASERARRAEEEGVGTMSAPEEMLAEFRNSARGPARPAQRIEQERIGELGLPISQEEQIRAAARGMMSGQRSAPQSQPGAGFSGGMGQPPKKFMFGDPAKRKIEIAYLIWFFIGQTSLHRVYCGEKESAIYQVALWLCSLVTLFIFPPIGLIGLLAWFCWLIGDLFMMPSMLRKFQAEHTYDTGVFS